MGELFPGMERLFSRLFAGSPPAPQPRAQPVRWDPVLIPEYMQDSMLEVVLPCTSAGLDTFIARMEMARDHWFSKLRLDGYKTLRIYDHHETILAFATKSIVYHDREGTGNFTSYPLVRL